MRGGGATLADMHPVALLDQTLAGDAIELVEE
jgi:hypothetical protein